MTIRLATPHDLKQLYNHRITFIKSMQQSDTPSKVSSQLASLFAHFENLTYDYLEKHLTDRTLFAFLAVENDQIISSCLLCVYDLLPTPINPSGKEGCLLNVYTLPEYQKQGYATQLVTAALELAKQEHIGLLRLTATDQGFPLYQKLGFIALGKEMQWTPSACPLH